MDYTNIAPIAQEVFEFEPAKSTEMIIPGNIVEKGVLISPSGMPSFRQDGVPELKTIERNYGTKDSPRRNICYIHTFHGHLDYDGVASPGVRLKGVQLSGSTKSSRPEKQVHLKCIYVE